MARLEALHARSHSPITFPRWLAQLLDEAAEQIEADFDVIGPLPTIRGLRERLGKGGGKEFRNDLADLIARIETLEKERAEKPALRVAEEEPGYRARRKKRS